MVATGLGCLLHARTVDCVGAQSPSRWALPAASSPALPAGRHHCKTGHGRPPASVSSRCDLGTAACLCRWRTVTFACIPLCLGEQAAEQPAVGCQRCLRSERPAARLSRSSSTPACCCPPWLPAAHPPCRPSRRPGGPQPARRPAPRRAPLRPPLAAADAPAPPLATRRPGRDDHEQRAHPPPRRARIPVHGLQGPRLPVRLVYSFFFFFFFDFDFFEFSCFCFFFHACSSAHHMREEQRMR